MNQWFFTAKVQSKPEMRYTPNGKAVTTFRASINNGKDADGNWRDSEWVTVESWENLAEECNQLTKGTEIFCDGRFHQRTYDKADGGKGSVIECKAKSVRVLKPR